MFLDEVDHLRLRACLQRCLVRFGKRIRAIDPERAGERGAAQPVPTLEAGPPGPIRKQRHIRALGMVGVAGFDGEPGEEGRLILDILVRVVHALHVEARGIAVHFVEPSRDVDTGRDLLDQPQRVGLTFESPPPANDVQ